jgi:hypothetical protein
MDEGRGSADRSGFGADLGPRSASDDFPGGFDCGVVDGGLECGGCCLSGACLSEDCAPADFRSAERTTSAAKITAIARRDGEILQEQFDLRPALASPEEYFENEKQSRMAGWYAVPAAWSKVAYRGKGTIDSHRKQATARQRRIAHSGWHAADLSQ